MRICSSLEAWIGNCVRCFFPKGDYRRVMSISDIQSGSCLVLYFPSQWSEDLNAVLAMASWALSPDGVLIWVERSQDPLGQVMCHQAEQYQKILGMRGVVQQWTYPDHSESKGEQLTIFQFWKASSVVSIEDFTVY